MIYAHKSFSMFLEVCGLVRRDYRGNPVHIILEDNWITFFATNDIASEVYSYKFSNIHESKKG